MNVDVWRIFIMRKVFFLAAGLTGLASVAGAAGASGGFDFGTWRDHALRAFSQHLFGVNGTLAESSTQSVVPATAEADPTTLATVAHGLRVRVATSDADAG